MKGKSEANPQAASVPSLGGLPGDANEKENSLDLLGIKTVALMKLLMLYKKALYDDAIDALGKMCANLMENGMALSKIIDRIESSIKDSHTSAVEGLTAPLGLAKFQLKGTNPASLGAATIKEYVTALERNQKMSLSDVQEAIRTDILARASNKYGADLGDFDFLNYKPAAPAKL